MRLINADTLQEQIPETSVDIFENCRNCSLLDKDQVLEIIDAAPTIDAVEVVRCKDCKWRNKSGCAIEIVDDSDEPKDDDYCSFGERE